MLWSVLRQEDRFSNTGMAVFLSARALCTRLWAKSSIVVVLPEPGAPKISNFRAISERSNTVAIVLFSGKASAIWRPILTSASQGRRTCWGCASLPRLISTALCKDWVKRPSTSSYTASSKIRSLRSRWRLLGKLWAIWGVNFVRSPADESSQGLGG